MRNTILGQLSLPLGPSSWLSIPAIPTPAPFACPPGSQPDALGRCVITSGVIRGTQLYGAQRPGSGPRVLSRR
jgi:hypothetical protein